MTWTEKLELLLATTRMDDKDEVCRAINGAMVEYGNAALEDAAQFIAHQGLGHLADRIRSMKEAPRE